MLYAEISADDRHALWKAFEKRFPVGLEKEFLLKEARLDNSFDVATSWENIFEALQHKPRAFRRLLSSAVEMRPDDSNLLEVAEILTPDTNPAWFIGIASAVSVAILTSMLLPSESNSNPFERTDRNVSAYSRMTQQPHSAPDIEAPVVIPVVEPAVLSDGGQEEQELERAPSPLEEVSVQLTTLKPSPIRNSGEVTQRCSFEGNGEIIGYWYAGATEPEITNGWTTVTYGRNVRIDYPEKHNGYNARTPVTCVLFDNMAVPVQDAPILVAGGKYWVPLRSVVSG